MTQGDERESIEFREWLADEERDSVLAAAVDVLVRLDDDGTIQSIAEASNPALEEQSGEVTGRPVASLFASGAQPSPLFDVASPAAFEEALLDPETETVTAPLGGTDGRVIPVSLRTVPGRDAGGRICLGHEISGGVPEQDLQQDVLARHSDDDLIDSVADPLYVLDATDCFQQVNAALVEYTGYERGDLLGREIGEILPGSDYQSASVDLRELAERDEQESTTFEATFVTKDGERVLTEAHATALTDADGNYAGSVGVLRDIRERKHRERNLDLLKQVLTRVFRHNVRNNLMIATGHAEQLASAVDDDLEEHADLILETVNELLSHTEKARLIETVIENDDLYETDLVEKVRSVVEAAREDYPDATIEVDLPATAVVEAHTNLSRGIAELVENAIEHAPSEEAAHVEIWIDEQEGHKTLFVEDESGGLANHEIDVLERGDESDLEHGSGVGLWLVRWLVEYSDAEMIVHRTNAGSLMGMRFGQQTSDAPTDNIGESPLADAPAHVRDVSPERFRGDTVIGRVDALDQLEEAYDSLERTGGHSVLVTGEAGIGKTTLVEQFRDGLATRNDDPVVATGVCQKDSQRSYHAFRDVLDDIPGERDISGVVAAPSAADDPEEIEKRKQALFADVADELRSLAADQPVVLVVEDLHWADQGTIDLFEYLVEEVGRWGHSVLFVGTYRTSDVDRTHPVLSIAERTVEAGRGTLLGLDPFDESAVRSLLSYMLDVDEIPSSFVQAVHDHTGGTPLFVNEVGRHFVKTLGPVRTGDDLPESLDGISVPETVETVIAERLDALPEELLPVVRLGAVIGEAFSFDLLRAASDHPVDSLVEWSNTLVRRQIWEQSEDGIEFVHGVVREQALETIPREERDRLHAAVAEAIETLYEGNLDKYAGRLGTHYEQIGEYETAFEYYRQAGEHASSAYANEDALEQYERALSLADDHGVADETTRAAVLMDLGKLSNQRAEYDRARENFETSLGIYRNIEDRKREAESLRNLGKVAKHHSEYDRSREYFEESLEITREIDDRHGEAKSLKLLGVVVDNLGEPDKAREYYEESHAIFEDIGDRRGEGDTLHNLGVIALHRGEYERAEQYYEESLNMYKEIGYRWKLPITLNSLGVVAKNRGEYQQAGEYFEEGIEISQEVGDRHSEAANLINLGTTAQNRGAYDRARECYEESLATFVAVGDRRGESAALDKLGVIARHYGDYDRARENFETSLEIRKEIGDRRGEAEILTKIGTIAKHRGAYHQAREYAEQSLTIFGEISDPGKEVKSHYLLGCAARMCGEYEQAQKSLTDALEIAREIGLLVPILMSLRELGAVARVQGAYDEAAEYLAECLDTFEGDEHRHQRGKAHLERTRLALAREDIETAREALDRAREIFAAVEATPDEARATLLRGRIAARTNSPDEAREHWREALDTFEDVGIPAATLETLERLVDLCREQDDDEQAEEYREQAVTVFENAPEPVRENHERVREWAATDG